MTGFGHGKSVTAAGGGGGVVVITKAVIMLFLSLYNKLGWK